MITVEITAESIEWLEDLQSNEKSKVLSYIAILEELGHKCGPPYAKPLKGHSNLYEITVNNYKKKFFRLFYSFVGDKAITFNGFTKTTDETPDQEIRKALSLKGEYLSE